MSNIMYWCDYCAKIYRKDEVFISIVNSDDITCLECGDSCIATDVTRADELDNSSRKKEDSANKTDRCGEADLSVSSAQMRKKKEVETNE